MAPFAQIDYVYLFTMRRVEALVRPYIEVPTP
mgnify:CR=1 FL=1